MSQKTCCDYCDKVLSEFETSRRELSVTFTDTLIPIAVVLMIMHPLTRKYYDLCDGCFAMLRAKAGLEDHDGLKTVLEYRPRLDR